MKRFFKNNGLSLVVFGIFIALLIAQSIVGYRRYNEEQQAHNQPAIPYGAYLQTGHFLESVGENWESEFLQMAAYVLLAHHNSGSSPSRIGKANFSLSAASQSCPFIYGRKGRRNPNPSMRRTARPGKSSN